MNKKTMETEFLKRFVRHSTIKMHMSMQTCWKEANRLLILLLLTADHFPSSPEMLAKRNKLCHILILAP